MPDKVLARTTVVAHDQESYVIGTGLDSGQGDIEFSTFTPCVLDDRQGLRRLFECIMAARAASEGERAAATARRAVVG